MVVSRQPVAYVESACHDQRCCGRRVGRLPFAPVSSTSRPYPTTLNFRHRFLTQRIFRGKTRTLKCGNTRYETFDNASAGSTLCDLATEFSPRKPIGSEITQLCFPRRKRGVLAVCTEWIGSVMMCSWRMQRMLVGCRYRLLVGGGVPRSGA